MHDYLIQINLSTINGQTLKTHEKHVVANLFFKVKIFDLIFIQFAFLDMDGLILTNAN